MPREMDFMNESINKLDGNADIPWDKVSGRRVFKSDSITGLNKTPVKVLGSFIQGGATLEPSEDPPFELNDLVENLLVDGTIVIRTMETPMGKITEFLPGVIIATKIMFVQQLPDATQDGKVVHRIWALEGERWLWRDVTDFKTGKEKVIDSTETGVAVENMFVFPNKKGILYDAQFTYRRLEEIERKVRKASNSAVSMVITGYVGTMTKLFKAFSEGAENKLNALSLPANVTAEFPKTTSVVDQLHRDFGILLPGYFKLTNLIEFSDSSNMSGKSRRLMMQQTLEFTNLTRKQVEDIYKNWNITVMFESLPILDADEKMKELNFLQALRDDGVINKTEYRKRAAKLT